MAENQAVYPDLIENLYQSLKEKILRHQQKQSQNKEKTVAITHSSLHKLPSEISPRPCHTQGELSLIKSFRQDISTKHSENAQNLINEVLSKLQTEQKSYVFGIHSDQKGQPLSASYAYAMKTKGSCLITYEGEKPVYITDAEHFSKDEKGKYRLHEDILENRKPIVDENGNPKQQTFESGHIYVVRENVDHFKPQKDDNGQITEWISEHPVKFAEDIQVTPEVAMGKGVQIMVLKGDREKIKQLNDELSAVVGRSFPYQLNNPEGKALKDWLTQNIQNGNIEHVNKTLRILRQNTQNC